MTANEVKYGLSFIKCGMCKSLYSTDKAPKQTFIPSSIDAFYFYEPCPTCGYEQNQKANRISRFAFKFIRWWRTKDEEKKDYDTTDESEEI